MKKTMMGIAISLMIATPAFATITDAQRQAEERARAEMNAAYQAEMLQEAHQIWMQYNQGYVANLVTHAFNQLGKDPSEYMNGDEVDIDALLSMTSDELFDLIAAANASIAELNAPVVEEEPFVDPYPEADKKFEAEFVYQ